MRTLSELQQYLSSRNQNKIGLYFGSHSSSLCICTAATVRSMRSSAGAVILEMARLYSTHRLWKWSWTMSVKMASSSSEDSEADMEEASEVEMDQLESSSDSSEDESGKVWLKQWQDRLLNLFSILVNPIFLVPHKNCNALLRPSSQRFDPWNYTLSHQLCTAAGWNPAANCGPDKPLFLRVKRVRIFKGYLRVNKCSKSLEGNASGLL